LIKIDTTESFTTALEAEPQGYRHFLNNSIANWYMYIPNLKNLVYLECLVSMKMLVHF